MNKETKEKVLVRIKEIELALKPIHFSRDHRIRDDEMFKIYGRVGAAYDLAIEIKELLTGEK